MPHLIVAKRTYFNWKEFQREMDGWIKRNADKYGGEQKAREEFLKSKGMNEKTCLDLYKRYMNAAKREDHNDPRTSEKPLQPKSLKRKPLWKRLRIRP